MKPGFIPGRLADTLSSGQISADKQLLMRLLTKAAGNIGQIHRSLTGGKPILVQADVIFVNHYKGIVRSHQEIRQVPVCLLYAMSMQVSQSMSELADQL